TTWPRPKSHSPTISSAIRADSYGTSVHISTNPRQLQHPRQQLRPPQRQPQLLRQPRHQQQRRRQPQLLRLRLRILPSPTLAIRLIRRLGQNEQNFENLILFIFVTSV